MPGAGLLWLLAVSLAMFLGSLVAGCVPLAFAFSAARLRLVSTFGAGLLVGTALVVIIPEGVDTLYSSPSVAVAVAVAPRTSRLTSRSLVSVHGPEKTQSTSSGSKTSVKEAKTDSVTRPVAKNATADKKSDANDNQPDKEPNKDTSTPAKASTDDQKSIIDKNMSEEHSDHGHSHHETYHPHKYIGPSLITGFAFMFLVDQISAHSHSPRTPTRIAVAELRESQITKKKLTSATIGLVVHAAADGIALGAASTSSADGLGLIIFLAIMFHKAPASLGLCVYLMQEGLTRRSIRNHLVVFSAAAPIAAILTYAALVTTEFTDQAQTQLWTGVLLLFSAGTFLYVATIHILPEIYGGHDAHGSHDYSGLPANSGSGGGSGGHGSHGEQSLTRPQIMCLLGGFITPMVLSINHQHG